jgi:hypothetical protein
MITNLVDYVVKSDSSFMPYMLGERMMHRSMSKHILYIKGRRGRNEAFHPSIRPVIRPIIHPWMASYNNPLQCEG